MPERASEVHGVSEVVLRTVKFCSITRKVSLKRCHPERSASGVELVRAMLCIGISPFPPRLPAARDPARQSLALLRSSTSLRMTRAVISASLRQQLHRAACFISPFGLYIIPILNRVYTPLRARNCIAALRALLRQNGALAEQSALTRSQEFLAASFRLIIKASRRLLSRRCHSARRGSPYLPFLYTS